MSKKYRLPSPAGEGRGMRRNGLLFTSVVKQANAAAVAVEDGLAQRFAIRTIRGLRSFQGWKNKP